MAFPRARVLVADDQLSCARTHGLLLRAFEFDVDIAYNASDTMDLVFANDYDVALLDNYLGDDEAINLIPRIKALRPLTEVIVVSGFSTPRRARAAVENGAYYYISKQTNTELLLGIVRDAVDFRRRREGGMAKQVDTEALEARTVLLASRRRKLVGAVRGACDAIGADLTVTRTCEALTRALAARPVGVLLVDTKGCDECSEAEIARLRTSQRELQWITIGPREPSVLPTSHIEFPTRGDFGGECEVVIQAALDRYRVLLQEERISMIALPGQHVVQFEAPTEFDVFLCYNRSDFERVAGIARRLRRRGIQPWFDHWEIQPGVSWQRSLEAQLSRIKSAAIFIGDSGIGPWQSVEIDAILREFVARRVPVIPVLLGGRSIPELPVFLRGLNWVDFRRDTAGWNGPIELLVWGITGRRR